MCASERHLAWNTSSSATITVSGDWFPDGRPSAKPPVFTFANSSGQTLISGVVRKTRVAYRRRRWCTPPWDVRDNREFSVRRRNVRGIQEMCRARIFFRRLFQPSARSEAGKGGTIIKTRIIRRSPENNDGAGSLCDFYSINRRDESIARGHTFVSSLFPVHQPRVPVRFCMTGAPKDNVRSRINERKTNQRHRTGREKSPIDDPRCACRYVPVVLELS